MTKTLQDFFSKKPFSSLWVSNFFEEHIVEGLQVELNSVLELSLYLPVEFLEKHPIFHLFSLQTS